MKRSLIVGIALAALVALPARELAQAKTDFSGAWVFDPAKSDAAPAGRRGGGRGGPGGGLAAAMTITQTPTHITIDRTLGQTGTSGIFKLDASESTNLLGDVFLSRSRVSWDGPKLVITTRKDLGLTPTGPMAEESKEIFSLEGGVLTILSTTCIAPAGEQTRKLVYIKKA